MSLYVERIENPGKLEVVLVHGWGMNSTIWQGVAEKLSGDFSLTMIDLPGLGRSESFPQPYTSDAVVELLALHAPERAIWLGWSMGGQLAIQYAGRFPERVSKLITVASSPCFVQKEDWSSAMDEITHTAFEASLECDVSKTLSRFAMLQTQGAESARETLKLLKAALKVAEPSAPVASLGLLREDVRPLLKALSIPVLQVFGEKDLLVPVEAAVSCEALTGSHSLVYSGAGHLPFISHEAQFVNDVTQFIQESGN